MEEPKMQPGAEHKREPCTVPSGGALDMTFCAQDVLEENLQHVLCELSDRGRRDTVWVQEKVWESLWRPGPRLTVVPSLPASGDSR